MRNLRTYFEIAFDDEEIPDNDLRRFAEDHLRRLSADDGGGEWAALAEATNAAYAAFAGGISDKDTHAAARQGRTIAMNAARDNFIATVRRREGLIRSTWDKTAPEYQEFFPHGLTEYTNATLGNAETLMTRFVNAATAHVATLGQPLVDEFAALRQAFTEARGAQLDKKAAVSGSRAEAEAARAVLERQLTLNLLTLALRFVGQPDRGIAFFDPSILRAFRKSPEEAPSAPNNGGTGLH